tara:strand:+ start:730 stop:1140 length:411 start_codon:yes stop_codon:yes gene_type:complete
MSWFSRLLGADKTIDNVLDKDSGLLSKVGGWVGNMSLTPEEIIEFNAKTVASVQVFVAATLAESTDRSRTRRSIAVLWIKAQLGIVLMCCIAAPWNAELAEFYFRLATSTLMITVTTAICIFFFGSHGIARMNEKK